MGIARGLGTRPVVIRVAGNSEYAGLLLEAEAACEVGRQLTKNCRGHTGHFKAVPSSSVLRRKFAHGIKIQTRDRAL
jgi:hypothetical protein